MEREKMIEKMAKDIPAEMKDPYQGSNITILYSYQRRKQIAKCLVSKNYRKVPEGAVVLTKEEAEEYQEYKRILAEVESPRNAAFYRLGQKRHDEICKETATEIYRELMGHGTTYVKKWIKNKYGVGVEE